MPEPAVIAIRRGALAGGLGIGLLGLMVWMVGGDAPADATAAAGTPPHQPAPPVVLPPVTPAEPAPAEPPPAVAVRPADPTTAPPPALPLPAPLPSAPPAAPAVPTAAPTASPTATVTAPATPRPGVLPAVPSATSRTATVAPGEPVAPPAKRPAEPVRAAAYAPESLTVSFASLADLDALLQARSLDVLLEYGDQNRYHMPMQLGGALRALPVRPSEFAQWVAEGRVSELSAGSELRQRLGIHTQDVRFLVVLGPALRDLVAAELAASPTATSVTISRGPRVVSRLARR